MATSLMSSLKVGMIGFDEPDGGVGMGPMGGDSGHDSLDALALARMAARAASDMAAVANSVSARAARAGLREKSRILPSRVRNSVASVMRFCADMSSTMVRTSSIKSGIESCAKNCTIAAVTSNCRLTAW